MPSKSFFYSILSGMVLFGCAIPDYKVDKLPNYDHLIGKKFSDVIFTGRKYFRVTRDDGVIEELEENGANGCVTMFGVRKKDDIIQYWRITPSPQQCLVRSRPLNV